MSTHAVVVCVRSSHADATPRSMEVQAEHVLASVSTPGCRATGAASGQRRLAYRVVRESEEHASPRRRRRRS